MKGHPGIKHLAESRRFPGGGWEVRYRDEEDKTRRRTFPKKQDALDYQASVRTDKNRGDFIDTRKARTPLRVLAEDWFKTTMDRKPKTRSGYRYILDAHILPILGDRAIGKITPEVLEDFLAKLGPRKASTKRNVFHVLSPILNRAVRFGYRRDNPFLAVDLPNIPKKRALNNSDVLTVEQVATLADAIEPEYRTLIFFAAYTGCRSGEIVALRVRHLALMDLNRSRVSVEESIADVSGELHFGPPKNGLARVIGIPRFLAELLVDQTAGKGPDEFVFAGVHGGPLRHSHFYAKAFKPALRRALPERWHGLRFHDLRHTAAALLIKQGAHPKAISERLGHSSIAVTMDVYGHLYDDHEEPIMDGLEKMFRAATVEAEKEALRLG